MASDPRDLAARKAPPKWRGLLALAGVVEREPGG
jgi:hypothetical protein